MSVAQSFVLGSMIAALSCTPAWALPLQPAPGVLRGRAAYVQKVQAEAGQAYSFRSDMGVLQAANPSQGVPVRASRDGILLGDAGVRLLRYGCADRLQRAAAVAPQVAGNRVEYLRPGLSEWYVNGPLGLEQGFTLQGPLGCTGPLSFEIGLGDGPRAGTLQAGDLYAFDASGRSLPTRMRRSGQSLRIEVDSAGAIYPVVIDPIYGVLQARLATGTVLSDEFLGAATAVSSDGSTALLGAYGVRDNGYLAGGAYVFVRGSGGWSSEARLLASDGKREDYLGAAVALSADGNTALIGAPQYSNGGSGTAYVYVRSGGTWTLEAKLAGGGVYPFANFGTAVSLSSDGNTAIVGARADNGIGFKTGAVYVFVRSGTTWSEQKKLVASDGAADDAFGDSTALTDDGNTALIGAPGVAGGGAAYVFVRSGTTWSEQKKLVASDRTAGAAFGRVALSGDGSTALVGAPAPVALMLTGTAYIFVRSGTVWSEQKKLVSADIRQRDEFGSAVALNRDGSIALIGASRADVKNTDDGAAYLFSRTGTTWTQQKKFAPGGFDNSGFGYSAALAADGSTAIAGEPYADDSVRDCGAANVYIPGKVNAAACTLASECNSGFCADGVCCDASCGSDDSDCQACSSEKGAVADGVCTAVRAGLLCRAASGPCADDALCQSGNKICPANVNKASTVKCRDAPDVCVYPAFCSGFSPLCPNNSYRPSTDVCRPPAGPCDSAELCTGFSAGCPADQLQAAGFQCRAPGNQCGDPALCDGSSVGCGLTSAHPDGSPCTIGTCQLGACRPEDDLAASLQVAASELPAGEPFSLSLTLANNGKSAAVAPEVLWTLPEGAQVLASSGEGWVCPAMTPVSCQGTELLPGTTTTLTLSVLLPSAARSYVASAIVQSATYDSFPGNNSVQATLYIKAPAPIPEPPGTPPASAATGCQCSTARTPAPPALPLLLLGVIFLLRRRPVRRRRPC